jgi:hypothetical protein
MSRCTSRDLEPPARFNRSTGRALAIEEELRGGDRLIQGCLYGLPFRFWKITRLESEFRSHYERPIMPHPAISRAHRKDLQTLPEGHSGRV